MPRSRRGPQDAASGRASGMWVNRIRGWSSGQTLFRYTSYNRRERGVLLTRYDSLYEFDRAFWNRYPSFVTFSMGSALVIFVDKSRCIQKSEGMVSNENLLVERTECIRELVSGCA